MRRFGFYKVYLRTSVGDDSDKARAEMWHVLGQLLLSSGVGIKVSGKGAQLG